MSYTTIYAFDKRGRAFPDLEMGNSHGSAPPIWDYVQTKMFPGRGHWSYSDRGPEYWDCWKQANMSDAEAAVFLATFDYAVIEQRDYHRFSEHCQIMFGLTYDRVRVNHWQIISKYAMECKHIAFGFQLTSVADDMWRVRGSRGRARAYDLNRDNKAFSVYATLDSRDPVIHLKKKLLGG